MKISHIKKENRKNTHAKTENSVVVSKNGLFALVSIYLDKAEYYYLPNRTLARIIIEENPERLLNIENVRTVIRSMKGLCGDHYKSKNICGGKYFLSKKDKEVKFHSPLSLSKDRQPFYLPLNKKIGCLFDVHVPFHDNKALDAAVNHLIKTDCKIILMQEMFDFYWQSGFTKDLKKPPFNEQKDMYVDFLYELIDWFPKGTQFYMQESNHDERWNKYMSEKARELFGCAYFGAENVFEYNTLKINYIKDRTLVKAGNLNVLHGHEFGGKSFGGVNPARWLSLKTKDNAICGHFHRSSKHSDANSLTQKSLAWWSVGCLCELTPDYMPFNAWNWGVCTIETDTNGDFSVDNRDISRNGKIL